MRFFSFTVAETLKSNLICDTMISFSFNFFFLQKDAMARLVEAPAKRLVAHTPQRWKRLVWAVPEAAWIRDPEVPAPTEDRRPAEQRSFNAAAAIAPVSRDCEFRRIAIQFDRAKTPASLKKRARICSTVTCAPTTTTNHRALRPAAGPPPLVIL